MQELRSPADGAGFASDYQAVEPAPAEVQALPGLTLLEFGSAWCGHCRAAQRPLAAAMAGHPSLRHLKIADGPGQPLGRAYRVKLWPTLVLLRDGVEIGRAVRPGDQQAIDALLAAH